VQRHVDRSVNANRESKDEHYAKRRIRKRKEVQHLQMDEKCSSINYFGGRILVGACESSSKKLQASFIIGT
jgi:hypothetical protein